MINFIRGHKALSLVILLIVILPLSIYYFGKSYYNAVIAHPFYQQGKSVQVVVKEKDTLYAVLQELNAKKLIKNPLFMKYYIKKKGLVTTIKPGSYTLSSDIDVDTLMYQLNKGFFDKNVVKVTIPEGKNLEEIASILETAGLTTKDEFIKATESYPLPDYIKNKEGRRYKLEGFLFPDTYEFSKRATEDEIIKIMLGRFQEVLKASIKETGVAADNNEIDSIVTMASVIEREAQDKTERPIISSVFYNRIKINMKLESCATVEYILRLHKTVLSYKDIAVDSPYNTYTNTGLPIGPICSPGKSCIEASLKPDKTDYLYFVLKLSENKNTHYFAKTGEEFEAAKIKYIGGK